MNNKITDLKRPDDQRVREIVNNLRVGAIYVEDDHITLNRAAELMTGYGRNELISLNDWFSLLYDEQQQPVRQKYDSNKNDGIALATYPVTITCKNGEQRLVEFSTCYFDGFEIWILFDVTDCDDIDEEIRLRDEVIRATSTGVIIVDARQQDNPAVFVNQAFEAISGYTSEEVLGRNLRFLHKDDLNQEGLFKIQNGIRSGHEVKAELRNYRKDGTLYWNELTIIPVHNRLGELTHFVGIQHDITRQKKDEVTILENQQRIRAILDTASDAIISIDRQGIITDANPATEKMFGYSQQELITKNIRILMPAPWCHEHDSYIQRYLRSGKTRVIGKGRELVAKRKNGSTFPIYLSVSEVNHINLFTGIIRDISEQKELQKQILEIATEEDRRIGHELHDDIQQQLSALGMMAKTVLTRLHEIMGNDTRVEGIISLMQEMSEGLSKTVSHVSLLAQGLVPVDIDAQGLRAALSHLSSRINQQYGLLSKFGSRGNVQLEDNFVATHLYRIAQEALNNAVKYSQSEKILISLVGDREKITLTIKDQGVGFNSAGADSSGLGLRIMGYRANLIGATLNFSPANEKGATVTCILPR